MLRNLDKSQLVSTILTQLNLDSKVSILKISTENKTKHPNRFQKLISTVDTPMLTYEILDSQPFYLRGTP